MGPFWQPSGALRLARSLSPGQGWGVEGSDDGLTSRYGWEIPRCNRSSVLNGKGKGGGSPVRRGVRLSAGNSMGGQPLATRLLAPRASRARSIEGIKRRDRQDRRGTYRRTRGQLQGGGLFRSRLWLGGLAGWMLFSRRVSVAVFDQVGFWLIAVRCPLAPAHRQLNEYDKTAARRQR